MIYLVEFEAYDPATAGIVTQRFATHGYTTGPADNPANVHFEGRVINPGNFERSVFASDRTGGAASIGFGYVELAIADGSLDHLASLAVDGRRLTIWSLPDRRAAWATRKLVLRGTMTVVEIGWRRAMIRLRDLLAELNRPVTRPVYAGTTTAGGMDEAEGEPDDLKDKPKPLCWGVVRNVSPVLANRYDLIFQVSAEPLASIEAVRDSGVALTFHQDYPSIAALRAASIPSGRYATALALGLFRLGGAPAGDITVDATGAHIWLSAGSVALSILERENYRLSVGIRTDDFIALHLVSNGRVGYWLGTESVTVLSVVGDVLDGVGAYLTADRTGELRAKRLDIPSAGGVLIDESIILDSGSGLERMPGLDAGAGIPAASVTMHYGRCYTVQERSRLDTTGAPEALKAFAAQEYRSAVAASATVKTVHPLAPDLEFNTCLVDAGSAGAEANRRLGLLGIRRDRYRVTLPSAFAADFDLGHMVTLKVQRFDLSTGKPFVVIGIVENLQLGRSELILFG